MLSQLNLAFWAWLECFRDFRRARVWAPFLLLGAVQLLVVLVLTQFHRPLLAPLYDIVSVLPYPKQVVYPGKARLAMRIGKEYRAAAIRRRHWEAFAQGMGVDEEPLVQRVGELVGTVPSAMDRVRERVAGSGLDGKFVAELFARIEKYVPARLEALQ